MTGALRELAATAPEIFVPDVDAAVAFFTDTLGFEAWRVERDGAGAPATFAVVALEQSVVLIAAEAYYTAMGGDPSGRRGGAVDIRIVVRDVDAMHERARANGVRIMHAIGDRPYGLRDFVLEDPWGFRWRFASAPLPTTPSPGGSGGELGA
jgi:uncharacterized glyoxalase superfamily protein PhnB